MLIVFLLIPSIILYIAIYAVYRPLGQYRDGILLSITLPPEALEDAGVQEIRDRYNRQFGRFSIGAIVAFIPVALTGAWFAVQLVYFLLWIFAMLFISTVLYRRSFRGVLALKREHDWGNAEEDEYWKNGFTYHNPQDKRLFVDKRVGVGATVNTGRPAGKAIMGGTIVLAAGVLFFAMFLVIRAEFTSPQLIVTPGDRIEIDYPMHSYDFAFADIKGMELVDSVPKGSKTNGEATNKYARGTFRLKGIGKSRLFIFKNNPPYIKFELDKTYVFFNDEDPEETLKLFEQLQGRIGQ